MRDGYVGGRRGSESHGDLFCGGFAEGFGSFFVLERWREMLVR